MELLALRCTSTMSKKQKNALLDEGLCQIVEFLQQTTGATFPRLVTASFLKYMFGSLEPTDTEHPERPANNWMTLAVQIEDGTISVTDVPTILLERGENIAIHNIQELKKLFKRFPEDPQFKNRLTLAFEMHERYSVAIHRWRVTIDRYSSVRQAIEDTLDSGGFVNPNKIRLMGLDYFQNSKDWED